MLRMFFVGYFFIIFLLKLFSKSIYLILTNIEIVFNL